MGGSIRVPVRTWIEDALVHDDSSAGIMFYETSDAPTAEKGIELLVSSCARLDEVRQIVSQHGCNRKVVIPYLKFYSPATSALAYSP